MPYLPSEIWLHILSLSNLSPSDLFLRLRRTNRQLLTCVDTHLTGTLLPTLKVTLSFGLPCYDARNPLRGEAEFAFERLIGERVRCKLVDVKPEQNVQQFVVRWERLRESSCADGGVLPGSLEWRMAGAGFEGAVRLREAVAIEGEREGKGAVEFEWRESLASVLMG